MVMNEGGDDQLLYIMLVEKGYAQPLAFRGLERIKSDFNKLFDITQTANAKFLALNREFEGTFSRIYVRFMVKEGGVLEEHTRQG
jgi:hypothetical protein